RRRRGSRLCRRWALKWREDGELLGQCLRATKCDKLSEAAYLGSGVGPKRETNPVPSEKCVARWGSEYDEIRMIPSSFARVPERCTGHLYMHFSRCFKRLDQL